MAELRETATPGANFDMADWLCFAASPIFAVMAVVTHIFSPMLCSMHVALSLDGMVIMYLLMSVFHLSPWIRLMSSKKI